MNVTKSSLEQQWNAQHDSKASAQRLELWTPCFPSYFPTFGNFLQDIFPKLRRRSAQAHPAFTQQSSAEPASVAIA